MAYLAVAFGGALGAISRYWIYNYWTKLSAYHFPFITLFVNVFGSLLIGIFFVLLVERGHLSLEWRNVINVGFLGAFTTFSTFSLDALGLFEQGYIAQAFIYILSSAVVCILAAWLGLTLARILF